MAGRKKEIMITISNEDDFLKYYDENYEKLVGLLPNFQLQINFFL